MRMHMRRFTRLTSGHSKKIDNHRHAVALHYMYLQFLQGTSDVARHSRDGSLG
jgi:hypothetical protein